MSTDHAKQSEGPDRVLKLALLGYGKMGKLLAELAPQRGFEVALTLDVDENPDGAGITPERFRGVDVCVDFTTPGAVLANIRRAAEARCHLVVGTTGWQQHLEEVRGIVERCGVGMVYAANFSIGVQLFFRLARRAAETFGAFAQYDPYLTEAHHRAKKDAPSGTALELQKLVEAPLGRKIPVVSLRAGSMPGTHEMGFDSEADTVIVRHTVRNRQGFAEGALYAARWVVGRKGLFHFAEVLETKKGKG